MKINIGCEIECFKKGCMENNLKIMPQRAAINKELLKAEGCPNPNHLNSEKAAYLLP